MAKGKGKDIRVVLVGCGGMSRAWLGAAVPMKGVQIVGLVDLNRQAAIDRAKMYELPESIVFGSLKEAIKQTLPDAVFDVTIPDAHDKVTVEALKAGCHVLGEKPMSTTLTRARKMARTAKQANRIYAVIQNRRYSPTIMSTTQALAKGKIGRIEEVHSDFFLGPHFGGFRDEMEDPLLVDMAIHTFDQARMLIDADPVSVYCHGFNPKRSWYKGNVSAVCIFEMMDKKKNSIVYTYRGSWAAEGLRTSWQGDWRFIGEKGTLTWDGEETIKSENPRRTKKSGLVAEGNVTTIPVKKTPKYVGHAALIDEFLTCIRTGKQPQTNCHDNIKSLAMVLAAVKSSKSGRREKVIW